MDVSKIRMFTDAYHLEKMRASHDLNTIRKFMIAFGAPTMSPKGGNAGFWHKVPNIPDGTVELRVYVPCYNDRVREEVIISRQEVLRLHGCVSKRPVYEIINLLKVCVGYPVKKLHWTYAEDQAITMLRGSESRLRMRIPVRFGVSVIGRLQQLRM
jgi:hypothetical protein